MKLTKQVGIIPLLGLDSNADPKNAVAGTCDLIENMWIKRTSSGGGELRKRFGSAARTRATMLGTNVPAGQKLATRGDEQLIQDGSALWTWIPGQTQWQVAYGLLPAVNIAVEAIAAAGGSSIDMAIGGGMLCCVYTLGGSARATFIDLATGGHIDDRVLISSTTVMAVKVVALASSFMVFASYSVATNLDTVSIAYATPLSQSTATASAILNVGVFGVSLWDVIRNGTNDSVLVALRTTTPNTTVLVWNANQTNGGTTTHANVPDQGLTWLQWDFSDGNGYLSYVSSAGGGLKTHTVRQSAFGIIATTVNDAAVVTALGMSGYRAVATNSIFICQNTGAGTNTFDFIQRSNGGAVAVWLRAHSILTRPFTRNGLWFMGVMFDNYTNFFGTPGSGVRVDQRSNYIIDVTGFPITVVAKCLFGKSWSALTGGNPSATLAVPQVPQIDSNTFALPLRLVTARFGSTGGAVSAALGRLDFSRAGVGPAVEFGNTTYFPGGCVRFYDGVSVCEAGFHTFPGYSGTPAAPAAGGGLTPGSVYQYTYLYRTVDAKGQIWRSPPAPPESFTLSATQGQATFTLQTLRLHEKRPSVLIEVYATVANGSTFYLVGSVANNTAVDTVTSNLAIADSFIQLNQQLYTTGGELPHEPFPPAKQLCSWSNRLFLAGVDDPTQFWVSDELIPGEGAAFSGANAITMEREGGAISALAEMDDRIIIGKSSGTNESIYELNGRGPAPNGADPFQQPARITANVGPTGPDAVVKTPQGVIFKSRRGFYLLPIGGGLPMRLRGVAAFEGLTITGATVLEDRELVVFTSASGTTLVYHFGVLDERGLGRWTTWVNQAAVDCSVWGGKFVYLEPGGAVREETTGFDDNGAAITAKVRPCWMAPTGLYGSSRAYELQFLGDIMGTFTLSIQLAYNYDTANVDLAQTKAVTTAVKDALKVTPAYGRAQAIQPTIQETSTTEGFRITALGLEVGVRPGMYKRPVASRLT